MEAKTVRITCVRFDPDADVSPHEQTYEVPFSQGVSVLNILSYIYENLDPTLAFFSCCVRGVCGRCTMQINGRPALACTALVQGDVHVAPLRGKAVVRDLVVEL